MSDKYRVDAKVLLSTMGLVVLSFATVQPGHAGPQKTGTTEDTALRLIAVRGSDGRSSPVALSEPRTQFAQAEKGAEKGKGDKGKGKGPPSPFEPPKGKGKGKG